LDADHPDKGVLFACRFTLLSFGPGGIVYAWVATEIAALCLLVTIPLLGASFFVAFVAIRIAAVCALLLAAVIGSPR
jgi:hypothetical protein